MKRLALIFITILTIFSCGDEVEFNSPAIRGNYNGNLWRASSFAADIDFGGFLIQGSNNVETLQLVTSNDIPDVYNIGPNSENVAIFRDANGIVFSTANPPDPSVSLYPVEGQIIVEDVINTTPKTLSGTFWFHAYTQNGMESVAFSQGVFHKVPLVDGLLVIDNQSICLQASEQVSITESNFNDTDTTMPNYTEVCNAYKTALINKIDSCGDPEGNLQSIIDSLGTCIP